MMNGRIAKMLREYIGANRRSSVVRGMHGLASFIESAYGNEGMEGESIGEDRVIERLAPAGFQVAFDIGANCGDWTLEALKFWPQVFVHAFEVAPQTFKALSQRMTGSADASRARLNGFGLSDVSGTYEMFYFPDHPQLTCDRPRHEHHQAVRFEAQLKTADAYAAENGIDAIDFVKIDVEGAEHRVLKGLERLLAERRIQCVQFEYGAFSLQTRVLLGDYYALLQENYWIGKIHPAGVEFGEYDWTMENFRFANFCCLSKARPDLRDLIAS
jgi:FkbM family methyltransferase